MVALHPLPLVLASSSNSRKKLLEQAGFAFEVVSPNIDEQSVTAPSIQERVGAVAHAKAENVKLTLERPSLILAADTVVVYHTEVMEKPRFKMTALEMLKKLNGNIHTVITAWVLINTYKNTAQMGLSETYVKFRELTYQDMVSYVNDNPVTQWAGGYNTQLSTAITFVDRIEGSLTGINGLPLEQIIPVIKEEYAHPYVKRKPA